MMSAAPTPADEAPDEMLARHQRVLQDLAALCMDAARTLGQQVAETGVLASGADPAASLDRLARAVRLTLALEARLVAQAAKAEAAAEAEAQPAVQDPEAAALEVKTRRQLRLRVFAQVRKEAVRRIVEQTIESEARERGDYERGDYDRRLAELNALFDTDNDVNGYIDQAVVTLVKQVCKALGVAPNLELLDGYPDPGDEPWARTPAAMAPIWPKSHGPPRPPPRRGVSA
jgi:hypothetical protein